MCCKCTGKYLCVCEAPLTYKNIYSPFLSTRQKEIFLTKKMPFFQKKKSQTQCPFSDFQVTPLSLKKLLLSSHFREISADIYSCGLYFIMAVCFPIHPLHCHHFQCYSLKPLSAHWHFPRNTSFNPLNEDLPESKSKMMKPHSAAPVRRKDNNAGFNALNAWTGFALQGLLWGKHRARVRNSKSCPALGYDIASLTAIN